MNPNIKSFYHSPTYTWTHVVSCPNSGKTIVIDPVLDYQANNARTSTTFIDSILHYMQENNLELQWVLETHAHADHLSSSAYLQKQVACKVAIGNEIISVQKKFKQVFNLEDDFKTDGSQFNVLLRDGDTIDFGSCHLQAIHTPGHTNDSMSYRVRSAIFIGDTLFSPDYGTARCDFPGGDAAKLFNSIQKLYQLDDDARLYLCHDYPPKSRKPKAWYSVKEQKTANVHIKEATTKHEFIALRTKRDKNLTQPKLIIPSIQVNIAAGNLPKKEKNGVTYLKIPLNVLSQ